MKYADLHVHTYYSDSTFSPEQVMSLAHKKKIDVVAITDHDTFGAIAESKMLGQKYGIEIVPGIEVSVLTEDEDEIHILGYYIDLEDKAFLERLKFISDCRIKRVYKVSKLLKEKGVDVTPEDIFSKVGKGTISRLHIARAIYDKGYAKTLKQAFKKYIGVDAPCYIPHMNLGPQEAIEAILQAKGVPVLAHPAVMKDDSIIPELVDYGLQGIEVYHTTHGVKEEKKYKKVADKYDLIMTGGSDCHGDAKRNVLLGARLVGYDVVEQLKQASKAFCG